MHTCGGGGGCCCCAYENVCAREFAGGVNMRARMFEFARGVSMHTRARASLLEVLKDVYSVYVELCV